MPEIGCGCPRTARGSIRARISGLGCILLLLVTASGALVGTAGASAATRRHRPRLSNPVTQPAAPCAPIQEGEAQCELLVPADTPAEVEGYEGSGELKGLDPQDLRSAYGLPEHGGEGRTVALVEAYDDPNAETDLSVYRARYGLSECTTANGCFQKVNEHGEPGNLPAQGGHWTDETSTDLDMVSAACQDCHLLLVEAANGLPASLVTAEETAVALGADVVSNSWNIGFESETEKILKASQTTYDHYFDHPGVPIVFSAGDYGYGTRYPATSPYTIAVGGTRLTREPQSARGWAETVWYEPPEKTGEQLHGTGSGCSSYEPKPAWQGDNTCPRRTADDIAADAAGESPVSIYNTFFPEGSGWQNAAGTSAAAPFVAGIEALSSSRARSLGAEALYDHNSTLNDVTEGHDGTCAPPSEDQYWCVAGPGYDGPTGNGTPDGPFTASAAPLATTRPARLLSRSSATLEGVVDPHGHETSYRFEYGETTGYGTSVPAPAANASSGEEAVTVTQPLAGLHENATYHYRLVATSSEGTSYGADTEFIVPAHGWGLGRPANPGAIPAAGLLGVSCASATACMAVGEYDNAEGVAHAQTQRWDGNAWHVTRMTEPAGATHGVLLSDSCSTAASCYAVGSYNTAAGKTESLVGSWNGTSWEPQAVVPPKESQSSDLGGISCVQPTSCTAVGEYFTAAGRFPLAATWNGLKWKAAAATVPSEASASDLTGVSCPSASQCTAIGWYETTSTHNLPLIENYSNKRWAVVPAAVPAGAEETVLEGISCTSVINCVASGWYSTGGETHLGLIEQWNGTSWQIQTFPAPAGAAKTTFYGVSCRTGSDCTAAGAWADESGATYTLVEHLNWAVWQQLESASSPGPEPSSIDAISCPASGACAGVGLTLNNQGQISDLVESGEAGAWRLATPGDLSHVQASSLGGLACVSASYCLAVGEYQDSEGVTLPTAQRWDGSSWQIARVAAPEGAREGAVLAVSCLSTTSCWAAGHYQTEEGKTEALIEHWNGSSWEAQLPTPPKESKMSTLRSLSCTSASTCIAAGEYINNEGKLTPLVQSWTGEKWKPVAVISPAEAREAALDGVSCSSTTTCVATGWYMTTTGKQLPLADALASRKWAPMSVPAPTDAERSVLDSVSCPTSTICTAAGWSQSANGPVALVERLNGTAWQPQPTPNANGTAHATLDSITCPTTSECTATGSYTTSANATLTLAENWNGASWELQGTPTPRSSTAAQMRAVACPQAGRCTATGVSESSGASESLIEEDE